MKKTKLFSALSLTALALSVVPYAGTAFAAGDGDPVINNDGGTVAGGSATSTTPATGSGDIGVGFLGGSLTLNQVPDFDFGYHTIGTAASYQLLNSGATPAPGNSKDKGATLGRQLVVTDQRSNRPSWNVTVGVLDVLTDTDPTAAGVLSGATLTMKPTKITYGAWSPTIGTDGKPDNTKFGGYYFNSGAATGATTGIAASEITAENPLKLDVPSTDPENAAQPIFGMKAANTADPGTYALDFTDPATATISVPLAKQKTGTFKGKLVWTLTTAAN